MGKGSNRHIPYIVDYMADKLGKPTHMVCDGQKYVLTGLPRNLMDWLRGQGIPIKASQITEKENPVSLGTRLTFKLAPGDCAGFRTEWLRELLPEPEPDPGPEGPRSCVGKKRYADRAHADRDMFLLITAATYVPRPGRALRVYSCPHCGSFHVGHQASEANPFQPTVEPYRPPPSREF